MSKRQKPRLEAQFRTKETGKTFWVDANQPDTTLPEEWTGKIRLVSPELTWASRWCRFWNVTYWAFTIGSLGCSFFGQGQLVLPALLLLCLSCLSILMCYRMFTYYQKAWRCALDDLD